MARGSLTILAVGVLSMLRDAPKHPYQLQQDMRRRGIDEAVKVRAGSLYSTIARMEHQGYVRVVETEREGRRPERTVYALTDEGEAALLDWLRTTITEPSPEFSSIGSAIAFLPNLLPDEAERLLCHRIARLHDEIDAEDRRYGEAPHRSWSRLFRLHFEYTQHMKRAEIAWLEEIAHDIGTGHLEWPEVIVKWHRAAGRWPVAEDTGLDGHDEGNE